MAETIVNLVLGKLADAVIQEALVLYGVHYQVERVQRDLTWIQSFLKDADKKSQKDERVKQWLNEVQEVGYMIEDVLDKFLVEIEGGRREGQFNILKRIRMPMKLIAKHKVGNSIDQIQQRLREIIKNTKMYGIGLEETSGVASTEQPIRPLVNPDIDETNNGASVEQPIRPFINPDIGETSNGASVEQPIRPFVNPEIDETSGVASVEQPIRPFINPDIDETEVVGFEVDKKTIVDQLIDTNYTRRAVISIVGAGGSGKTTLALEVYKSVEVKRHFGISMWLAISQEYKLIDILMKMLQKIREVLDSERQNKGEDYFITELNKSMIERKYIVVLDDVWSSNVWTQLEAVLPNANNGSRVLITTRFINIPEEIDRISKPHVIQPLNEEERVHKISKPHVLQPLNEEESTQLLLKKVFPNRFANECPNDLLHLATQFAKKCNGLPLALAVVGGILSRKSPDYITWDEVMRKMYWQTDGGSIMNVISRSYEDLPDSLNFCFMYFGAFPEDYQIKTTTLIQLWIAEGFIRQDLTKSQEEIAESYLEELVQRCMVQVSRRSCTGKIKYCCIHDILRDLAIQKAKEENFLTVVSKNDTKLSCGSFANRVALHGYDDKVIEHAYSKNLRSLINFEDVPNLNRFGKLRVLHMSTEPARYLYGTNCLKGLNALTALKYVGLEDDNGYNCMCEAVGFLKRSPLTYMKKLQTVCAPVCTTNGELPSSFWRNKQLRHINLFCCSWCEYEVAPEGPPSAKNLRRLLTLKGVRARQDWVAKLPNFPNIHKLGIVIPIDVAGEPLINLLSNLNYLGSLHLEMNGSRQMTFTNCISAFRNHRHLHSLSLVDSIWPRNEVFDYTLFPPLLIKLTLKHFCFEEDPMPQLEKLSNLTVLKLSGKIEAADVKQMICSRGGFGHLQRLVLHVRNLEEWKIEEGTMPMLNKLELKRCQKLQIVPDLQYLANLQEFTVFAFIFGCLDQFNTRLQGEDQWKIKHISLVTTYSS